jgi:NAD(P)-dependent dehydrogenase (short-subunit alcohol dehydrogenase family)
MKNILITGGSRGIGKACVYEFSNNGYDVCQ